MRQAVVLVDASGGRAAASGAPVDLRALECVGGRPFIDHVIWNLRRHGVGHVALAVAEEHTRELEMHVGTAAWGVSAQIVVGEAGAGAGAMAFEAARSLTAQEFWLVRAETLFDMNLLDLALRRVAVGLPVASAMRPGDGPGGVYALDRRALEIAADPGESLNGVIDRVAQRMGILGVEYESAFLDPAAYTSASAADAAVSAWRDKPMVLLDRDGVLNEDRGYVHAPQQFAWIPGALEGIKWLNDRGVLAVVVTNQSGIARGYYSEAEYSALEEWIADRLAENGAHLDAVYHCPHHPTEGSGQLTRVCDCRKPAPGLVLEALAEFGVSPGRALYVGDKETDMAAAAAAGVEGVLFTGQEQLIDLVRGILP